jgi:hypothetical protein
LSELLDVKRLAIPDVLEITPKRFGDNRGYFSEVYNRERFAAETGRRFDFIQVNQSLSADTATLRGLHFQAPPYAQTKLVTAVTGAVWFNSVPSGQPRSADLPLARLLSARLPSAPSRSVDWRSAAWPSGSSRSAASPPDAPASITFRSAP